MEQLQSELSFGEQLVGIKFDPSDDSQVHEVKTSMAKLANLVEDHPNDGSYIYNLIKGDALRSILHAQMAIVKLVTLKHQK